MNDNYYAVIMAGGGGTRLWPLSRKTSPKQMLPLVGEKSLFQIAVDRLEGVFSADRIYVVTVAEQAEALKSQCPDIPSENFLLEPMPRGTAPVVGMAAVALQQRDPEAVMAVLTADHIFQNEKHFQRLLLAAYDAAVEDHLVTLGIAPTYPATGYGYIQKGEFIDTQQGLDVFQVEKFIEKPDEKTAQMMFERRNFAWNSGMFVWRVSRIMNEFERQMPNLNSKMNKISDAWKQPEKSSVIQKVWPTIKPETIDYGIMENANDVVVIPAHDLGWNDVGSWEALFDVLPANELGNIVSDEKCIAVDTRNTLVYQDKTDRLVVTIGLDDVVIVETDDVLLVCKKDQSQQVRQVVDKLRETNSNYL